MQFIDLQKQYITYKEDISNAINKVLTNCNFIMGSEVNELEKLLAKYTGVKHAVSCASGTDALLLAIMSLGLKPGDEVITTPFTFIATSEIISLLGAKPVFVDINPETFNIDETKIPQAITKNTRGIIAVDIFGQCANYDELSQIANHHKIFLIEDAAQSLGAQYKDRMAGGFGDVACTSFFPAKPLGCYGDGGMLFTNNTKIAEIAQSLRIHGKGTDKYDNIRIGLNARLDTLQAAILIAKFKYFPNEIDLRNKIAMKYKSEIDPRIKSPIILEYNLSVFAQYTLNLEQRDLLAKYLNSMNIPTAIHYPKALHLQQAFADLNYKEGDFPVTESICKKVLSIPMHPFLSEEDQNEIIYHINHFANTHL